MTHTLKKSALPLQLLLLASLLRCQPAERPAAAEPIRQGPPPNVLVISVCSIRNDHTNLSDYARKTTPNLAALAADAVVFDHAVTQWPKTVPAVAALVTGRFGHSTGVMRITPGQRLGDDAVTMAEHFKQHGYATGAFISSSALHNGTNIFPQGFDVVDETFRKPEMFGATTQAALQWVRQAKQPFLLWAHYNNAHQPYYAPDAPPGLFVDDEHYDASVQVPLTTKEELDLPIPPNHPFRDQILRPDMHAIRKETTLQERPQELAFYIARYDAGIFGADRRIGELLQGIADLLPNTIVVVVGDHGEALGGHGYYFGHGRLPYDDVARVPYLIRPPGGVPRRHVAAPVPSFSLFPTLAEMAGLPAPQNVEAPSLAGFIAGRQGTVPPYVFTESGYALDFQKTVRDRRWKLIHVPDAIDQSLMTGAEFELYDLANDPSEAKNVFDANPEEARRLQRVLINWSAPWRKQASVPGKQYPILDPETEKQLRALGYIK